MAKFIFLVKSSPVAKSNDPIVRQFYLSSQIEFNEFRNKEIESSKGDHLKLA